MKIKVFLLVKNDFDLLDDYIEHYTNLFGRDSIVVIDNGSTPPIKLDGITVHRDLTPFSQNWNFMTEYMRMYAPSCDWILPAETDEFLFAKSTLEPIGDDGPYGPRATGQQIEKFLEGVEENIVYFKNVWEAVPDGRPEYQRPAQEMKTFRIQTPHITKLFIRAKTFVRMVMWEHTALAEPNTSTTTDVLSFMHFHNTSTRRNFEKAKACLESFKYLDTTQPIQTQITNCENLIKTSLPVEAGHKLIPYLAGLKAQVSLMDYLNTHASEPEFIEGGICEAKYAHLIKTIPWQKIKSVLEIGFNTGKSSEFFLQRNSELQVTSFDIGEHAYSKVGKQYIDERYPGRHTIVWGDSSKTIPKFPKQLFDLILIDGGHEHHTALSDLVNCMRFAGPNTILLMDDVIYKYEYMAKYSVGPTKAWIQLRNILLVEETDHIECGDGQGLSIGRYIGGGCGFNSHG